MKNSTVLYPFLAGLIFLMFSGCVTLQQPLPGSLWGNWTFEKTGYLNRNSNSQLQDYRNVCPREGDRIHFTSDHKMSLKWYDRTCAIHYYEIGRYHVDDKILTIDLAPHRRHRDRPFPPITKFRIMQINNTTLKLEEIPSGNRSRRDRTKPGVEPLVFVFMKLD